MKRFVFGRKLWMENDCSAFTQKCFPSEGELSSECETEEVGTVLLRQGCAHLHRHASRTSSPSEGEDFGLR